MEAAEVAHLVDEQLVRMAVGFGVEIVLAFPVVGGKLERPVIASAGSYDRVRVDPARAFRYAVRRGATGLVVAHNHPVDSGPSEPDRAVTRRLVSAGLVLGVPLLAHVVSEPGVIHELVSGQFWVRGDQKRYGWAASATASSSTSASSR